MTRVAAGSITAYRTRGTFFSLFACGVRLHARGPDGRTPASPGPHEAGTVLSLNATFAGEAALGRGLYWTANYPDVLPAYFAGEAELSGSVLLAPSAIGARSIVSAPFTLAAEIHVHDSPVAAGGARVFWNEWTGSGQAIVELSTQILPSGERVFEVNRVVYAFNRP